MNCPVCPRRDIPDDADTCPNCGTDFRPLRRVRELPTALFNEGLAMAQSGQAHRATARLEAALTLDPGHRPTRVLLAKLLLRSDRAAEAALVLKGMPQAEAASGIAQRLLKASRRRLLGQRGRAYLLQAVLVALAVLAMATAHMAARVTAADQQLRYATEQAASLTTKLAGYGRPSQVLSELTSQAASVPGVVARLESNGLRLSLDQVSFASGSAQLLPEGVPTLNGLAPLVQAHVADLRWTVEGHTDPVPVQSGGPWADNWELGLGRARAVARCLSDAAGIPLGQLLLRSPADSEPPYAGDTPEQLAKNRTVTIWVEYRGGS